MTLLLKSGDTKADLNFIGFNQDNGCFAAGTSKGFRIFNSDPFKETFQRDFKTPKPAAADGKDAPKPATAEEPKPEPGAGTGAGGIGYVEMLFRSNILALVGGGAKPQWPPNKVMIWDDHQSRCIGELSFRNEVKAVRLRRDRVVVILERKVYVYNFADLKLVDQIETTSNPKGIAALSPFTPSPVLVVPGLQKGHVRVDLYEQKKTTLISAHDSALACVALNYDATRLVTASEKGTLIRLFDTTTGQALQELRRGADKADILSLAINPTSQYLAVSSDKGTVHVFALKGKPTEPKAVAAAGAGGAAAANGADGKASDGGAAAAGAGGAGAPKNATSSFSLFKSVLPKYFSSEWSFATYRVPDTKTVVAFGADKHSIIVVSGDGMFYKAHFDPEKVGQECAQESYASFAKADADA